MIQVISNYSQILEVKLGQLTPLGFLTLTLLIFQQCFCRYLELSTLLISTVLLAYRLDWPDQICPLSSILTSQTSACIYKAPSCPYTATFLLGPVVTLVPSSKCWQKTPKDKVRSIFKHCSTSPKPRKWVTHFYLKLLSLFDTPQEVVVMVSTVSLLQTSHSWHEGSKISTTSLHLHCRKFSFPEHLIILLT